MRRSCFYLGHMSTRYINAPFSAEEYKAVEAVARIEGRNKGQQVRAFTLKALGLTRSAPAKSKRKGAK